MAEKVIRKWTPQAKEVLPPYFFTHLPEIFTQQSSCIYQGRNKVHVWKSAGQQVVIKKYGKAPIFNRVLYSVGLRSAKAQRSYQNSQKILSHGFKTPLPFMQEIHYRNGLLEDSYFVSAWAQGTSVKAAHKNSALLRALAHYTAQLHEKGLMHRDYILNNILFTEHQGHYQFELIDINRFIFQNHPLSWFYVCVNLMQPFHDEKKIKKFVSEYARVRQVNEKRLLFWVLLFRYTRNGYSRLKKYLRRLPGAHCFSRKAKRGKKNSLL